MKKEYQFNKSLLFSKLEVDSLISTIYAYL